MQALEAIADIIAGGTLAFGYVHPYPDGNGRTARFLVNAVDTATHSTGALLTNACGSSD